MPNRARSGEVRSPARVVAPTSVNFSTGTFTDRVDGTGVLETQVARDLGVVGIAGRASGLDLDLRRDQPHDVPPPVQLAVAPGPRAPRLVPAGQMRKLHPQNRRLQRIQP